MTREPQVVGLCWVRGCGGQITKTFIYTRSVVGRPVNFYNWTCTKGGDSHLDEGPAMKTPPITTDAPAAATICAVCSKPIVAGEKWTVVRVGRPVHSACGDPLVLVSYPRATKAS
jgi:hypothetical protein